jgi:hypothetical protein
MSPVIFRQSASPSPVPEAANMDNALTAAKHSRDSSATSLQPPAKKANVDEGLFGDISTPSDTGELELPSLGVIETREGSGAASSVQQEIGTAHQPWEEFYSQNLFTGNPDEILNRQQTPSDMDSDEWAWKKLGRPDVRDAFEILELYYHPEANEARLASAKREVSLEFHPDTAGSSDAAKNAAKEEMQKINHAYDVALAYVRERDGTV